MTIGIKMIALLLLRRVMFVGFFRKRPASGNFLLLVMECWNLGLTILSMIVRLVKVTLISIFYIGRLDTPLFAPGVGTIAGTCKWCDAQQ